MRDRSKHKGESFNNRSLEIAHDDILWKTRRMYLALTIVNDIQILGCEVPGMNLREQFVLKKRFNLDGKGFFDLEEIAQMFPKKLGCDVVARERVRQISQKGMERISMAMSNLKVSEAKLVGDTA